MSKILQINPHLFNFNGGKKSLKKKDPKTKPLLDKNYSIKTNKLKKELLKRVKDYQKTKETETYNEDKTNNSSNNLFNTSELENNDFEREFNKSLTFLHELSKKKKEKRNKTLKTTPHIDVNIDIPKDSNMYNHVKQPTYSCLKNGSKPTFKDINQNHNKTQKNTCGTGKSETGKSGTGKKIIIDLNNNKYYEAKACNFEDNPIIATPMQEIVEPPQIINTKQVVFEEIQVTPKITSEEIQVKPVVYSYDNNMDTNANANANTNTNANANANANTNTNANANANANTNANANANANTPEPIINTPVVDNSDLYIPKINRITKTYKYTLGKKKGSNHVGLIIKNRETQKKIRQEVNQLKQQPIQDIKNYLRNKNLIKLGSQAPNDVLRKLYEDSILAGEITNANANNLVYNFIN